MWRRAVLAGLVTVGCVADETTELPDAGPAAGATFTQAQAGFAGDALAAGVEDSAQRFGPVAPHVSSKARQDVTPRAGFDAGCATLSGDTSDADGDSIPAAATMTLDCSARRLGFTGRLAGTESVSDLQPGELAWAFEASTDLRASLTGPFGGSAVVDTLGSIVASQAGLAGPYALASTLDVSTLITNVRGVETEITEAVDWTVAFTPELAWTPGGIVVRGSLAVDGAWRVTVAGRSGDAVVSTPTPLTMTPSCGTLITAGVIEASFALAGRTETITVRWSGCDQHTVGYDPDLPSP